MKQAACYITFSALLVIGCKKDHSTEEKPYVLPETKISSGEYICNLFFFETDTFYFHKYETDPSGYQLLEVTLSTDGLNPQWNCPVAASVTTSGKKAKFIFHPDSVEEGETRAVAIQLSVSEDPLSEKIVFLKKNAVPWLGIYNGYNLENPSDTFSIELTRTDNYGSGPACCISYVIKNLPNGINTYMQIPNQQTAFHFSMNNECDSLSEYAEVTGYTNSAPKGFGHYSNGRIFIDYYYKSPMPDTGSSIIIRKQFTGIKQN
ncbi:MAG: hypothetical protein ACOZCO_07000 [Bacteroidota bacterium]